MVNAYSVYNQPEPVQAMSIDGLYLEEVIDGYRTLRVEGREPLSLEIVRSEASKRDGARYKRRRIDSRKIVVHYSISADSPSAFEEKYNQLKAELYKIEESQLIFDDEPDKYFVGTYRSCTCDYPGRSAAVGKIEIECADPFKYAVSEQEVSPDNNSINIDYKGTYKAYPVITAVSESHDNGFYSFAHSNGATIQIGDPSEIDKESIPDQDSAETVLAYNFTSDATITDVWQVNQNAHLVTWAYPYIVAGAFGRGGNYIYPNYDAYPSPDAYTYFFGPTLSHDFTAAEGTSHKNFEALITQWFAPVVTGSYKPDASGGFDIYFATDVGNNVCGFSIWRNKAQDIQWSMIVNARVVKSGSVKVTSNPFGKWHTNKIRKLADRFEFTVGGTQFAVSAPALEDVEVANISLIAYFAPHSLPIEEYNALAKIVFRSIPQGWDEIQNKIAEGAVVVVDAGSGKITMDGAPADDLGDIANDFESFVLQPGKNQISCAASEWVDDAAYTMRYREVYL